MASTPVLDAEIQALIAQLVADSFEYFADRSSTSTWNPSLGPSQIGTSYLDYEQPLSSYDRQLLDGLGTADSNAGWTTTDTPSLNWLGATSSPQPMTNLALDGRWDPDSEMSEEYKQDRIMAAQHKEVMEERVLNGLRMPSPAPVPAGGRIAAVAAHCRYPAVQYQRTKILLMANGSVQTSQTCRDMHRRGRSTFRSYNSSRGRSRGGIITNGGQPCKTKQNGLAMPIVRPDDIFTPWRETQDQGQRGRLRYRRAATSKDPLSRPIRSKQITESDSLSHRIRTDDLTLNAFQAPRVADWSRRIAHGLPENDQKDEQLETLQGTVTSWPTNTSISPNFHRLLSSSNYKDKTNENKYFDTMPPQPTSMTNGKSKGKERAVSPPSSNPQHNVPQAPNSHQGNNNLQQRLHQFDRSLAAAFAVPNYATTINRQHHQFSHSPAAAAAFGDSDDYDIRFDEQIGCEVVHFPHPYRKTSRDRQSNRTITEIRLGENEGDPCVVRQVVNGAGIGGDDYEGDSDSDDESHFDDDLDDFEAWGLNNGDDDNDDGNGNGGDSAGGLMVAPFSKAKSEDRDDEDQDDEDQDGDDEDEEGEIAWTEEVREVEGNAGSADWLAGW